MTLKRPTEPKKVALHLEEYVPGLLSWLSNKLAAGASQAYRRQYGLGIVEWRILSYLAVYDWGTGAQMSQFMGIDKAAISRGAAFLQTKKLIKNRAGFGRNLEFGLTAKGRQLHDRIIRLALARQDALLSGLSKNDVSALIGYLHILLKNLAVVEAIESRKY
jgi:DNA-binding MarR family transcriptional regulator